MSGELDYGMAGNRPYGLYYQHSGRVPISGVIIAAIAGLAAAVVGAAAYAYLDLYIPIAYANILGTVGFGALIGAVTAQAAKAGKMRSATVALALVGVITLIGYYVAWVVWVYATFHRLASDFDVSLWGLVESPDSLWEGVKIFNKVGTWTLGSHGGKGENVSGIFLSLIWIAEAITIFVSSFGVALMSIKAEMFCEMCGRWCGQPKRIRQTAPGDADHFRRQLESHNFACLDTLAPPQSGQSWDIEYSRCSSCDKLHSLSITHNTTTVDKKGNSKTTKKVIVNRLLLDSAQAAAVTAPKVAGPVTPPAMGTAGGSEEEAQA